MEEFISSNDLKMTRGKLFNWRVQSIYHDKDSPIVYVINVGTPSLMIACVYEPSTKLLHIAEVKYSDGGSFRFLCETIYDAELIVNSLIKGYDFEIEKTIYQKK
jgi:hypothetical protein